MNKILLALCVSCFSIAYSQTLNFNDSKFKALILSSNPSNDIAKNLSGNSIAVDANGDGEIQLSEAQQVKILTVKVNGTVTYANLPDTITDALLFSNVEELYIKDSKSAVISYVDNPKIKKVLYTGSGVWTDNSGTVQSVPIDFSFENCSSVSDINNFAGNLNISSYYFVPISKLRFKNCSQLNGNITITGKAIEELYIENCNNITSLLLKSCYNLKKLSVPNLSSLINIKLDATTDTPNPSYFNQNINLIANNCVNLQEITTESDHYNTTGLYIGNINVDGCTSLKKIKGLNAPSIDFSAAGLINLEELDCSFYNRYGYYTSSGSYFGDVTSLNLSGLPKLKTLTAFNQKITNDVNFSVATALENIDITNSCATMNTVNVSNLANLSTLQTSTIESSVNVTSNLQKIIAKNCTALTNFIFKGNDHLKELDIQNCTAIQKIAIGYYAAQRDGIFNELNTINLKQCTGLKELELHNTQINTLDISECVALQSLGLVENQLLSSVNISNNINLEGLSISGLPLLSQVNTSNNTNLKSVFFNNCPQITQLNFSNNSNFQELGAWNMPDLVSINCRNGSLEGFDLYLNNSNLSICVDDAQLADLQAAYPDITFTTNCGIVSKNNQEKNKEIKVFPNPAKDFIQIQSDDIIKNVKIFNAQERMIFNQDFNQKQTTINLSTILVGAYVMKITTDKSEVSKKIIKE
ncbi:T9SS type A sorting domain-containing protein [Chryseobacterium tongliaoense]|uniref:T9SS type A sorting domain-containing protein n=1 Tax=Chryseobacterium tongliaoense TaxID=3240933 RepID=UPI003515C52D